MRSIRLLSVSLLAFVTASANAASLTVVSDQSFYNVGDNVTLMVAGTSTFLEEDPPSLPSSTSTRPSRS